MGGDEKRTGPSHAHEIFSIFMNYLEGDWGMSFLKCPLDHEELRATEGSPQSMSYSSDYNF